jgi:hypothetical protein
MFKELVWKNGGTSQVYGNGIYGEKNNEIKLGVKQVLHPVDGWYMGITKDLVTGFGLVPMMRCTF